MLFLSWVLYPLANVTCFDWFNLFLLSLKKQAQHFNYLACSLANLKIGIILTDMIIIKIKRETLSFAFLAKQASVWPIIVENTNVITLIVDIMLPAQVASLDIWYLFAIKSGARMHKK